MLVSFYAQIFIIGMSLLVILLPFLGLPQTWDRALTTILGVLIFSVGLYALYGGYVRILKREERRLQEQEGRGAANAQKNETEKINESKQPVSEERSGVKLEKHDYSVLQIVRD
ncbi:MAG: hypothetical protein WDZ75_01655 [Candidatus Paceibacterota bacterium]